jgi:hypothetical protein
MNHVVSITDGYAEETYKILLISLGVSFDDMMNSKVRCANPAVVKQVQQRLC